MKSDLKFIANGIQITRVFDAPRETVFEWWSSAAKLQQWFRCKAATGNEITMDFRVGGSFTQKMQIPGMGEAMLAGIYDEIIVPEKISYHADLGPAKTQVTVEFIAQGSQTKVILTHEGLPEFLHKPVSQGTLESLEILESTLAGDAMAGHA
jgi:uncharacterized protein YndB with AHSA1/START domain